MQSISFAVRRLKAPFGAEICGVDFMQELDDHTRQELEQALWQNEVLIFREQHLTQMSLAELPMQTGWALSLLDCSRVEPVCSAENFILQTDSIWQASPPVLSFLYVPADAAESESLFASRRRMLDDLSGPMKRYLEDLNALHDASNLWRMAGVPSLKDLSTMVSMRRNAPPRMAPLIGLHPISGDATLAFSSLLTTQLEGVSAEESEAMLGMLREMLNRPECQTRVQLEPGTLLVWDNHAVQHHPLGAFNERSAPIWHMAVQAPQSATTHMNDLDERPRRIN